MTRIVPLTDSAGDPATVTGQAILYAKTVGGVVKAYILASDGSVLEMAGAALYFNGADVLTPNVAFQYLGIHGADLVESVGGGAADIRIFQTERIAGVGGVDSPVALNVQASRHFLENSGASETVMEFNLPVGSSALDGHIHTFVNESIGSTRTVRVNFTGRAGATSFNTSAVDASLQLIWNNDDGAWCVVSSRNWA